jgi:iron complex outermembrane recepter protein
VKRLFALVVAMLAVRAPAVAARDDEPPARTVEEIIVTAQRREENLHDVPISMSVIDAEFIERQSITDFRDLSPYVPNVNMDNAGVLPEFNIRGFGANPVNKAFEQTFSLVLDGVPYSQFAYLQGALFDTDRIEILRGPQGTLFGKNATAGVVNVITKDPTADFAGSLSAELGEPERRRVEVGIGGPLVTGLLNFRIAGLIDVREGFVTDTTAAVAPRAESLFGGMDRKGLRFKIGLPNVAGVDVTAAYEALHLSLDSPAMELGAVPQKLVPFYKQWDPQFDAARGNFVSSIDSPSDSEMDFDTFVANASDEIGGWGIHAVAGYARLKRVVDLDADFSPAPIGDVSTKERQPQTTFELRLNSPSLTGLLGIERLFGRVLGSTDLTLGFFFQRHGINDSVFTLRVDPVLAAEWLAFIDAPPGAVIPSPGDLVGPDVPVGRLGRIDTMLGKEISKLFFDQTATSIAGYGQVDWHLMPQWTALVGMRLSDERKRGDWRSIVVQGTGAFTRFALGRVPFTRSLSRSELQFTPRAGLKYDWTENINLYATWAKGFRAGGFNEFASVPDRDKLEYEAERVTSWEVGSKMRLLGGAAALNVGLFWMHLDDYQALTQDPVDVTFSVENAGAARARGIESDLMWLPTAWLSLRGAIGVNDSEYLEFPFGSCIGDNQNTDGDQDARCDFKGQPLDRAPKWVITLVPSIRIPLATLAGFRGLGAFVAETALTARMTAQYKDVHFISLTRDPRGRQPAFFRFGANVGLANAARGWEIGVTVENFTNQFSRFRTDGVPLAQNAGTLFDFDEPPRFVFGRVRWSF